MLKSEDDGQSSEDESDLIEEDELKSQEQLEQSFRQIPFHEQEQQQQESVAHIRQINESLEMIYILFSAYKEDLMSVAAEFNCTIKISMNKLKIRSSDTQQQFELGCSEIVKYLSKIVFEELTLSTRNLIYESPYLLAEAGKSKISMTKFNNKIYIHSQQLKVEDLKRKSSDIFKGKKIFKVPFKSSRFKNREVYDHLRAFLTMTLDKHRSEFLKRNVIMEIDREGNSLNFLGERERDILAAKNTFRNILSSAVVLIFKYENISNELNQKLSKAKSYSETICNYPVYMNRFMNQSVVLISKENILKNLLKKKKLSGYMGFSSGKVEVGMFLVKNHTFNERKEDIIKICSKKGYDFTNFNGGIYSYFRKIFLEEEEEKGYDIEEVIELLIEILEQMQARKERFEIPEAKQRPIHRHEIEVMDGKYYETGEVSEDQLISDQLKRTVMSENLRMSKLSLVRYNLSAGEETSQVYWFQDGDSKVELNYTEFKVGIEYFKGKYKAQETHKIYYYQNKLTVL